MRISIVSTVLADPTAAAGRLGPSGLTLNGQQIVDDAEFFRAAAPVLFDRGSAGVVLQFAVERSFTTLAQAEAFLLQHPTAVPRAGLVTCECGDAGGTETLYLPDAILETVAITGHRGVSVAVQYTIRGAGFASDVPPEEIPGEPDDGEGEFIVLRRGRVSIDAAATTVDIVFSAPLSSVPTVTCTVSRPAGGDNIWAHVEEDTLTVNGFTAELSGAPPDGTYKLNYIAVE